MCTHTPLSCFISWRTHTYVYICIPIYIGVPAAHTHTQRQTHKLRENTVVFSLSVCRRVCVPTCVYMEHTCGRVGVFLWEESSLSLFYKSTQHKRARVVWLLFFLVIMIDTWRQRGKRSLLSCRWRFDKKHVYVNKLFARYTHAHTTNIHTHAHIKTYISIHIYTRAYIYISIEVWSVYFVSLL